MSVSPAPVPHPGMGFRSFVVMIAFMMAVNALAIDSMLPALPAIGHALGVASENERQWVVTAYLLGFGVSQLAYGPLSDRYGRRPLLLAGLALFVVFSIAAAFASSFAMLLAARAMQGIGSAATRVLSVSIVRDCYAGRRMARVMSLTFIVFLTVPILAPSIGQLILIVAPWPWIFGALAIIGGVAALWLFGQSLNIYSMIGLVLLIGLVAKNSILLVDLTNQRREEGLQVDAALRNACPIRMRPVLMTSATIILALFPAALGLGAGAETNQPLSIAVIGGMISSTLLTLVVVPAVYSLVESRRVRRSQ